MSATKKYFACAHCGKKTSATNPKRIAARLCAACEPDLDALPVLPCGRPVAGKPPARKPAKSKRGKDRKSAMPKPAIEPVTAVVVEPAPLPPIAPDLPANEPEAITVVAAGDALEAVPVLAGEDATALDTRIAEAREAMNRLAADLSAKRIELAALRDQRRVLGPATRVRRDPDAPRRPTLLDAAAQVMAGADAPMQAKAIWRAIVERGLWQTPNGGKTPYATLAAALMRDIDAKGTASRFVKAGRGLFA